MNYRVVALCAVAALRQPAEDGRNSRAKAQTRRDRTFALIPDSSGIKNPGQAGVFRCQQMPR
jgi:hypothetical protein